MSREYGFGVLDAGPGCLRGRDRPATADAELPLASHIVTSRRGYTHHGIYVGNGRVVHYRGLSRGWRAGPVEEVSLAEFASGRPIRVRPHESGRFDGDTVVARARSRLGEDGYRMLSNNCEHFCEWCVTGKNRCRQIEELLARPQRALLAVMSMLQIFSLPPFWETPQASPHRARAPSTARR